MLPENDDGNIEYKLKLLNVNEDRIKSLATQMRYRCNEGDGEAIYNLGVEDDGTLQGLTEKEYTETINNLNAVAEKNNYTVTILSKSQVVEKDDKYIYEVLIREHNDNKYTDIKVAIAGHIDAGKSSLLGALITGINDNGRGLSRSYVCNYIHELKSGRTSSISHQILGYDYEGKIVNYQGMNKPSWADIVSKSAKIISFFDLAGHEKYLKTTILGLASSFPDFCIIVIDGNNGIKTMTKEHILLCVTLKIPFIITVTKIDMCKDRQTIFQENIKGINKFLSYPGIKRIPLNIKNKDDIILATNHLYSGSTTPIFYVSNVSGEGLDELRLFLNIVGKNSLKYNTESVEYHIDHVWNNVVGVGTVIGGHLMSGTISVGDKLWMGPNNGSYEQIVIKTIQCKKIPVQKISHGTYVCLGIKKNDKGNIKRGNVIVSHNSQKLIITECTAKINVLRTHATTIKVGYEPIFHAHAVRQVIKVTEIKDKKNARNIISDDECLRNGDFATVKFEFKYRPQFIKVGTRFILCEGKTKVMGEILDIES